MKWNNVLARSLGGESSAWKWLTECAQSCALASALARASQADKADLLEYGHGYTLSKAALRWLLALC